MTDWFVGFVMNIEGRWPMGLAGLEDHFPRAHIQWWGDMTPVWPLSVKGSDFRYLEQGYEREYKG